MVADIGVAEGWAGLGACLAVPPLAVPDPLYTFSVPTPRR
jgi:hypothetical protein